MKRAVLLHGTDAAPESSWRPWLRDKLEAEGYLVWLPDLPGKHRPNREVYSDFLLNNEWDFTDNIVVGHSSGAVSVLNLLMDPRCPKIALGIAVSAWSGGVPKGFEERSFQFEKLFPPSGFDFALIKEKADKLAFIHSDNDPYCPMEQAAYLAEQLGAPLKIVHNGDHLGSPLEELPEIWEIIQENA